MFWLLYCYSFLSVTFFIKWFVATQLWNWYHQQRKHNSFLLVGGTIKRFVKLESLRMPFENQILTPWDMYEWEDENIESIKFFCFNRGHCFRYLNQNRLTTAETYWWQKKLSLFLTKRWNKGWAIYPVSW